MNENELVQLTIEKFWDTIPPVWGRVRCVARTNATREFGLTLIQFHILRHIYHGAHSVAELADRQQISRPAISQALDSLVANGLVMRSESEKDRRYNQLELTEKGKNLLSALFQMNRQWMAEKMSSLTPEELDTIIKAMTLLKNTFNPPLE